MMPVTWKRIAVGVLLAVGVLALAGVSMLMNAQQAGPADLILTSGEIITVDQKFSIAQAVAVRGDRILAVGTNEEINRLAGSNTRRIDLRGRAVTPGFIDNHSHFQEEGAYWTLELRLDGIESRRQALEMIRAKAQAKGPGQWVFTVGGWSPDQFTDDSRPFTREELDTVAPNNPVYLQVTRQWTFVNSRAIEAIGMDKMDDPAILRDAGGRLTGVIDTDDAADKIRDAAGFLRDLPKDLFESSSLQMMRDSAGQVSPRLPTGVGTPTFTASGSGRARSRCASSAPVRQEGAVGARRRTSSTPRSRSSDTSTATSGPTTSITASAWSACRTPSPTRSRRSRRRSLMSGVGWRSWWRRRASRS